MSNYPPGVTGNEPQITGEWPCDECGGRGYDEDEDGKYACPLCKGTGIYPEDAWATSDVKRMVQDFFNSIGLGTIDAYSEEDYLTICTELRVIGGNVVLRED